MVTTCAGNAKKRVAELAASARLYQHPPSYDHDVDNIGLLFEDVEQNRISAKKPATDRRTGRTSPPYMTTSSGLGSARLARRTWQVGEARDKRAKQ